MCVCKPHVGIYVQTCADYIRMEATPNDMIMHYCRLKTGSFVYIGSSAPRALRIVTVRKWNRQLSTAKKIICCHTHDGSVCMPYIYGLPFTINIRIRHVSINLPYIRIRHGIVSALGRFHPTDHLKRPWYEKVTSLRAAACSCVQVNRAWNLSEVPIREAQRPNVGNGLW